MRRFFVTGVMCLGMFFAHAQLAQPSSKVHSAFDKATIQSFSNEQLEYWNFYGEHSFIVHEEMKPGMQTELLSTILKSNEKALDGASIKQSNFNPFDYNFTPDPTNVKLYLVDGTDKIVQFNSQLMLDKDFGYYMKNKKKNQGK